MTKKPNRREVSVGAEQKGKPLSPEAAKAELDRLFKFLLTHQFPMAPDPEPLAPPDMGPINIKSKRRVRQPRQGC